MRDTKDASAEYVYELLLDSKHRVHGVYEIGKGAVDSCCVDPKEVFKAVLISNSPAFTLVHNHPSGVPNPSTDDIALVQRLSAGADMLGINFLDSVIVGDGLYFSFYEAGMMPPRVRYNRNEG
jgi:DNA repair protein RadC